MVALSESFVKLIVLIITIVFSDCDMEAYHYGIKTFKYIFSA